MPGSASLFHIRALLESDYAILKYILHFFALCCGPKVRGAWHNTPTLNMPQDMNVLMVKAY